MSNDVARQCREGMIDVDYRVRARDSLKSLVKSSDLISDCRLYPSDALTGEEGFQGLSPLAVQLVRDSQMVRI
jgi:hypothetical protein